MPKLDKVLLSFLQKAHRMTKEQAAELLYKKSEDGTINEEEFNENFEADLLKADQERVKTLQEKVDTSKKFDEGYNKAKKETLEKFEKKLRKDFSVKDEKLNGTDLIKHIVNTKSEQSKLSADDVKKHPLFLELEASKTEEIEKLATEYDAKIEGLETGYQKSQTLKDLKKRAITLLDAKKPVLPKDAVAASNQKELFANIFDAYEYQKDGEKTLVLEDGKRKEDAHGNPIYFEDLVDTTSSQYFEFQKQNKKGTPGEESGQGGGNAVPKNEEEFNKAYFEANTPEERQEIQDGWDAANPE